MLFFLIFVFLLTLKRFDLALFCIVFDVFVIVLPLVFNVNVFPDARTGAELSVTFLLTVIVDPLAALSNASFNVAYELVPSE